MTETKGELGEISSCVIEADVRFITFPPPAQKCANTPLPCFAGHFFIRQNNYITKPKDKQDKARCVHIMPD